MSWFKHMNFCYQLAESFSHSERLKSQMDIKSSRTREPLRPGSHTTWFAGLSGLQRGDVILHAKLLESTTSRASAFYNACDSLCDCVDVFAVKGGNADPAT